MANTWASTIGLRTKSSQPAARAVAASSSNALAVRAITRVSWPRGLALIFWVASRPVTPGMRMSIQIACGSHAAHCAIASLPFTAPRASIPEWFTLMRLGATTLKRLPCVVTVPRGSLTVLGAFEWFISTSVGAMSARSFFAVIVPTGASPAVASD